MNNPQRRFLTAGWHNLAMLNFEVDPALVARYVPAGTEIDFFQGRTYLSVVGFRFLNTRLLGVPIPFHRDFDEVNLRCYVKRTVNGRTRRGVTFIRELVPKRMVALVANRVYNENYIHLPMRSRIVLPQNGSAGRTTYEWRHGAIWHRLSADIAGEPIHPAPGSEPEFITEHYWGYTRQRDGGTLEYQVEHPPWRVWTAVNAHFECDVAALYGSEFAPCLRKPPTSAFVADGSEVIVRRGVRLGHPDLV
jgi:uncharacterized protein YqjF (DUF2071 family)